MKKIGILTFCTSSDNYGQILQAYALQRYLRKHYPQYEVVFFHIDPFMVAQVKDKVSIMTKIYAKTKLIERFIRTYFHAYILRRQKYIKRLEQKRLEQVGVKNIMKKIALSNERRRTKFDDFKKIHIALHKSEIEAFKGWTDELYADCYIAGSDQIWNAGDVKEDNSKHWVNFYTLNFLPKDNTSKKLAYAASFGKRNFTSEFEKQYFQNALAKFDAISLRESHNIETLNQINLKSVCVPDPSMLLSKADYEMLINQDIESGQIHQTKSDDKVRKKSVFVYMLGNETSVNKDEVMDFLQKHNDLIYTNANINLSCAWDYKSLFAPSPQEWLACVKDAKLIITNSFHGCALAIVMNTPFIALKLGGGFKAMNTRFEQLFEIFGLHNRLVENLIQLKTIMNKPIDWNSINKKLESWRNVGVEFLAKNLNNL